MSILAGWLPCRSRFRRPSCRRPRTSKDRDPLPSVSSSMPTMETNRVAAPFKSMSMRLSAWVPTPWANSAVDLDGMFVDRATRLGRPPALLDRAYVQAVEPDGLGGERIALQGRGLVRPDGRNDDSKAEDHHTDQNRPGEAALHDRTFSSQGCRQLSPSGNGPGREESTRSFIIPSRSGRVKASPVRPSAAPRRATGRRSGSRRRASRGLSASTGRGPAGARRVSARPRRP